MEVLEIKPVKNKEIKVYMINRAKIKLRSIADNNLIDIFSCKDIDFATIDEENENLRSFNKSSLAKLLEQFEIPYYTVDIPEYAMGYLIEEIVEKEDRVNELVKEFLSMRDKNSLKGLNLKSWIDVLTDEIEEKRLILQLKLRPQWLVKKILDIIKSNKKKKITFVHFAQDNIFMETMKLLKELNIEIRIYEQEEETLTFNLIMNREEISQWKC